MCDDVIRDCGANLIGCNCTDLLGSYTLYPLHEVVCILLLSLCAVSEVVYKGRHRLAPVVILALLHYKYLFLYLFLLQDAYFGTVNLGCSQTKVGIL